MATSSGIRNINRIHNICYHEGRAVNVAIWLPCRAVVASPAFWFGVRLWASVCLAMFIAFELELDNSYWAGMSAAAVCQPRLGASLRKGYFRMIGTVVGAVAAVILSGLFPQQRLWFLLGLAVWGAACGFASRMLRNFASYAAALAGYTAAIIAAGELGATGASSGDAFMLAVTRATEICIGIASAGLVLAGTDFGGARHRLAAQLAGLAQEVSRHFLNALALAGPSEGEARTIRRELTRRVIALDVTVDEAMGESSDLRPHSPRLERATSGLLSMLSAWRLVARHLEVLPREQGRGEAAVIRAAIPPELFRAAQPDVAGLWRADPTGLQRSCLVGAKALLKGKADSVSQRLLSDWTAEALLGLEQALSGIALLDVPRQPRPSPGRSHLRVPDLLPCFVSALRVFVILGVLELLWMFTAWPYGGQALVFGAISVLLLSPRGDQVRPAADGFAIGTILTALWAGAANFLFLPLVSGFGGFCVVLGLFLVPVGWCMVRLRHSAMFAGMVLTFMPLLGAANGEAHDGGVFFNSAVSIVVGTIVATVACRLVPPVPPAMRVRRLLSLTLRDLRRLAVQPAPSPARWERCVFHRLYVLPDLAEPVQRAQLLAALAVGKEIIRLRRAAPRFGLQDELNGALAAFVGGRPAQTIAQLTALDRRIGAPAEEAALKLRAGILAVCEALTQHGGFFSQGARP
ncbi:MAG TPA: FUSC family protein [Acidocella sp.]|nr:FUSC family protein [Acidocella sp.]